MKVNIRKALELFDERHNEHRGHASSIIGILGEDINAALFKSYMMRFKKKEVNILENRHFQAASYRRGAGPRLDRWIEVKSKKLLYQQSV